MADPQQENSKRRGRRAPAVPVDPEVLQQVVDSDELEEAMEDSIGPDSSGPDNVRMKESSEEPSSQPPERRTFDLDSRIRERPRTYVLGAAALGFLIGYLR